VQKKLTKGRTAHKAKYGAPPHPKTRPTDTNKGGGRDGAGPNKMKGERIHQVSALSNFCASNWAQGKAKPLREGKKKSKDSLLLTSAKEEVEAAIPRGGRKNWDVEEAYEQR